MDFDPLLAFTFLLSAIFLGVLTRDFHMEFCKTKDPDDLKFFFLSSLATAVATVLNVWYGMKHVVYSLLY